MNLFADSSALAKPMKRPKTCSYPADMRQCAAAKAAGLRVLRL